jgi:2-keto-4-pentenoate hydratase
MDVVDPRLRAALADQLKRRDSALAAGARRVGWKLGIGAAERLGDLPAVGHLTSATELEPGGCFDVEEGVALHADVELAVRIGADGEIAGYGPALELVDLRSAGEAPDEIVRANIFHRGFAFGSFHRRPSPAAHLIVDDESRAAAPVEDVEKRVAAAARVLASVGERLSPGDRVLTGSIVQEPVTVGELVVADLGPLGSVGVRLRATGAERPP